MKPQNTLIYEDNDLIVINKQPGMLSVPDRYDKNLMSVSRWLSKTHSDAKPLHRLDRHTSGLLCFARNEEAFRHFSIAFEKRNIQKIYQAIVMGVPSPESGLIDKPLLKLPRQNQVMVAKNGKPSQTFYALEESYGSYAHLRLRIVTGRTHQIRVHLQSIGHPLLVDITYGGKEAFFLSEIKPKYKNRDQERPLLSRTPLHASTLTLPMMDGIPRTFEAPLPKDMRAVIRQMQLKQR